MKSFKNTHTHFKKNEISIIQYDRKTEYFKTNKLSEKQHKVITL